MLSVCWPRGHEWVIIINETHDYFLAIWDLGMEIGKQSCGEIYINEL